MFFDKRRRGKVVVFLGPDGAGKSTIIRVVEEVLVAQGKNVRSFYFAPGLLKRYRPKDVITVTTSPHDGEQYGNLLSLAKLGLMLFEFRVGLWKATRRHDILLFDRFIHDLLADPTRYRLRHARGWLRLVLAFAPRPDLVVIVDAPAETIQARKQEVSLEETKRQLGAYKELGKSFPPSLLIENTNTPSMAAGVVITEISKP